MNRCKLCVMPDTRPDHVFVDGVCPACINHAKKPDIDWDERHEQLLALLDRHDGKCIVPSSGGKDSTYQVIRLKELGADVTIVTATTCHLTPIGRKNIDNLSRFATTIEVSPNKTVRAKLNRLSMSLVGDCSWPEHAGIFSTPFRIAAEKNIPLIFFGENPQNQYGGPKGTEKARIMTRRWTQEFGGFLGLRQSDFVGIEGITKRDMADYELPENIDGLEAHFLGQYEEWDSHRNTEVSIANGMEFELPCEANWWKAENQDNAQTGLRDHFMYLKYGYGRGCTQISVDVREGLISRGEALIWIKENDGKFPEVYAGVTIDEVLERMGVTRDGLSTIMDQFTNWEIFRRVVDDARAEPMLIC